MLGGEPIYIRDSLSSLLTSTWSHSAHPIHTLISQQVTDAADIVRKSVKGKCFSVAIGFCNQVFVYFSGTNIIFVGSYSQQGSYSKGKVNVHC